MTFERELRWLDAQVSLEAKGLPKAGATHGLGNDAIRSLLQLLGDPQLDAPVIHLTGTNGKGSTAHMISLILREHGLRVGTYGSPHVSVINERIQIDAEPLTDDERRLRRYEHQQGSHRWSGGVARSYCLGEGRHR